MPSEFSSTIDHKCEDLIFKTIQGICFLSDVKLTAVRAPCILHGDGTAVLMQVFNLGKDLREGVYRMMGGQQGNELYLYQGFRNAVNGDYYVRAAFVEVGSNTKHLEA